MVVESGDEMTRLLRAGTLLATLLLPAWLAAQEASPAAGADGDVPAPGESGDPEIMPDDVNPGPPTRAPWEPVVAIPDGVLRGALDGDDVVAYLGIPYGAPTGGENRFLPPQPVTQWAGERDATAFGPRCPQSPEGIRLSPGISEVFDAVGEGVDPVPPPIGEDCLVLNVWTPRDPAREPLPAVGRPADGRPVMVWLHGGAFVLGSGSVPWYDGAALVRRGDVVVVTLNHRLGALGFLQLDEAYGEAYAASGNAGMLDIVQALEWVRDNIAAFGGDPDNVTIFGESGGGAKVSTLLAMPAAQGLFHRAAIQSGPALKARTPEQAGEVTRHVLRRLRLRDGDLAGLQAATLEDLQVAQESATRAAARGLTMDERALIYGFAPVVDGGALPTHPFADDSLAVSSDVPILVGTNRDEMTMFFGEDRRIRNLPRGLLVPLTAATTGRPKAKELVAVYGEAYPDATPGELAIAAVTDLVMRRGAIRIAERRLAAGGGPTFVYEFHWPTPALDGLLGATHALEIPFVFDNVHAAPGLIPPGAAPPDLAGRMSEAWIALARHGEPGHDGLPAWPAYTLERRATMIFDEACEVVPDPPGALREAWPE